jgi:alpha-mannosidase
MAAALLSLALLAAAAHARPALQLPRAKRPAPAFTTSSTTLPGAINVHIQPHTHLDLGWLKTFDEYLIGRNNSIQAAGVRWVYDSAIQALLRDPNRRFIAVEMGFLMRWLDTQPPALVAQVQQLVAQDRLQLVNSGWCMHDEATATYSDAVDQMTLGARLANATFGPAATARVAWSIDPFGHSATQGVLSSQMGHGGFFYGREDFQEQAWQIANNATEYVWRPSPSLGAGAQIFAGVNPHGYDPPVLTDSGHPLFEWDVNSDAPGHPALLFGPLQPHPDIDGYNVPQYIQATLALAQRQAAYVLPDAVDGTQHLAWQFGTDFNYAAAEMWFTQIDGLMDAVNANQTRVHLLYSTPRMYLDAKLAQRTAWPLKPPTDPSGLSTDQFPYATNRA